MSAAAAALLFHGTVRSHSVLGRTQCPRLTNSHSILGTPSPELLIQEEELEAGRLPGGGVFWDTQPNRLPPQLCSQSL